MVKVDLSHLIDIAPDQFFEDLFFNEDYNAEMYRTLDFKERTVLEKEDRGDTIYRRVRQVPNRTIPGAIQKVIRVERIEYNETSTYNKRTGRVTIEIQPGIMPDRIKSKGELWVEPAGPGRCTRRFVLDIEVKMFGIGGLMEKEIAKDVTASYDKSAAFTNRYIADHLKA